VAPWTVYLQLVRFGVWHRFALEWQSTNGRSSSQHANHLPVCCPVYPQIKLSVFGRLPTSRDLAACAADNKQCSTHPTKHDCSHARHDHYQSAADSAATITARSYGLDAAVPKRRVVSSPVPMRPASATKVVHVQVQVPLQVDGLDCAACMPPRAISPGPSANASDAANGARCICASNPVQPSPRAVSPVLQRSCQ